MENFINKLTRTFNSGDIKTFEQTMSWCKQFADDYKRSLQNARTQKTVHIVKTPDQIRADAQKAIKDCTDSYRETAATLPSNEER